jgi:hypothetical protein
MQVPIVKTSLSTLLALGFGLPVLGQSANSNGLQGTTQTPLVLPGNGASLNPVGSPGSRLLNNVNPVGLQQGTPSVGTPGGTQLPSLNFGASSIGRLSPPTGTSGVSGIGRLGPPGSEPNLMVTPNLSGPPTLSPAGVIGPIANPASSVSGGGGGGAQGGPLSGSNAPPINPTNPVSNSFQVNPTGSSGLRNPSNNFRP